MASDRLARIELSLSLSVECVCPQPVRSQPSSRPREWVLLVIKRGKEGNKLTLNDFMIVSEARKGRDKRTERDWGSAVASAYPTTSRPAQLLVAGARLGQLLQWFWTTLTTTGDLLIEGVLQLKKTWITLTIGGGSFNRLRCECN